MSAVANGIIVTPGVDAARGKRVESGGILRHRSASSCITAERSGRARVAKGNPPNWGPGRAYVLKIVKELRGADAERPGQANEGSNTDVSFAAFDAANVIAVEARLLGEFFLAHGGFFAQRFDLPAKSDEIFVLAHGRQGCGDSRFALHTISVISSAFSTGPRRLLGCAVSRYRRCRGIG